jgi:hypothetical protein
MKKWTFKKFLFIAALAFFSYHIILGIVHISRLLNDSTRLTPEMFPKRTDLYLDIFPKNLRRQIRPGLTHFTDTPHPVGTYTVSNENFDLLVYRMLNTHNLPLNQFVSLSWGNAGLNWSENIQSRVVSSYALDFNVVKECQQNDGKIVLSINGKILERPFYNDSLINFGIHIDKCYARYDKDQEVAFYIKKSGKQVFSDIPVEILFLKKENYVYLLLLSKKKGVETPLNMQYLLNAYLRTD